MRPPLPALLLALALAGGACARPAPVPEAEFLVAAGDSTWWVQTGDSGVRVRGAPLLLARLGGRFHEVYVADDDRSFEGAVFVSPRLFRRDLVTGDSALVWEDSSLAPTVAEYARAHPDDRPLADDEEPAEDAAVAVTSELTVVDVHGAFLSFEYHRDVDDGDRPAWHTTRRGVVDLRTGRVQSVASLFGGSAEARIVRLGRRAYLAALDSVLADSAHGARLAARALGDFRFDPGSFVLDETGGRPAVAFHAPGRGVGTSGAVTLPLGAIRAGTPAWWRDVSRERATADEGEVASARWRDGGRTLEARYDSLGASALLVLRDDAGREWPVARVGSPVLRVHWFDRAALDSLGRRRLATAFREAAAYDEDVRHVAQRRKAARATVTITTRS